MSRFLASLLLALLPAAAQVPPPVVSPEVHADGRVTFRLRAPNATKVQLSREGGVRVEMQKGEHDIWSVTTEPLAPNLYSYSFIVDGISILDPVNSAIKPNLLNPQSLVHVPGSTPWDLKDVPHGSVHRHFYRSGIVGDQRDFYVYTPPGYDASAKTSYPTLYLLHGFSDDASGWTSVGRAHIILDNLIAEGKVKPMLVVMPLGYGAPEIVVRNGPGFRNPELVKRNFDRFRDALLQEVIPLVEKTYRVSKDRTQRAIAGLSMGGSEALLTGLNALDRFAWVGAFSSGGLPPEFEKNFPSLDAKANEQLKLLWIACGKDDRLIGLNRNLIDWLNSRKIRHTWIETEGAHTWMVWRRYLADFTPLLFR
ncbi:MAG: esterase [Bryobacteraceae bacterium]|nr:esterase [Bryobacteraceae bacterium]